MNYVQGAYLVREKVIEIITTQLTSRHYRNSNPLLTPHPTTTYPLRTTLQQAALALSTSLRCNLPSLHQALTHSHSVVAVLVHSRVVSKGGNKNDSDGELDI